MKDFNVDADLASEFMQKEVERIGINLDTLLESTIQTRTDLFFELQSTQDREEQEMLVLQIQAMDDIILDLKDRIYGGR